MNLTKTRTTTYTTTAYQEPAELTFGAGSVAVTIDWWDSPAMDYSLMLRRETVQTRWDGVVVQRTIDTWVYGSVVVSAQATPTEHRQQIYARVWLPGVNWRERLQLVEESQTTYDLATEWVGGPLRSRKITAGYVIYDQAAEPWSGSTPTADGQTAAQKMTARGQRPPTGSTREIPDTARSWRTAINQAAVVEEHTVNQIARWVNPLEEVREDVEVDGRIIRRWRVRYDYLTGLTEVDGPHEELRPGLASEIPVEVTPPTITATSAGANGVMVDIRGGGAVIEQWVGLIAPVKHVQRVAPDSYIVYRRVTARGPRTYTGDAFAIVSPPPPRPEGWPRADLLSVEDLMGAPASALPPQQPDTEPDTPTTPEAEAWVQVGEIENQSAQKDAGDGMAVMFDREVEDGWSYEYYAIARVREKLSEQSNLSAVTYSGPRSFRSTINVRVASGGNGVTLDVAMPPDPLVEELGLADGEVGYGETLTIDPLPAVVEGVTGEIVALDGGAGYGEGNPESWPAGLLTDALDLGRAIGLRYGLRNRDRDVVTVRLAAPIFSLDRGGRALIPPLQWEAFGGGLRVHSRLRTGDARWVIEGFETTITRTDDAAVTATCTVELEEA